MSDKEFATLSKGDPFSIRMVGSNEFVKEQLDTLVLDFEEPHYGYNGEYYDEFDRFETVED